MRYLIISDMHGNWDALAAVLRRVRRKRFDTALVLGDLVGYGAAPNQVVEGIRDLWLKSHCVRGNHDKVVAALEDGSGFNQAALIAATWTTHKLTAANLRFIRELPQGPLVVEDQVAICHGSPLDEDTYVFSEQEAWEIFHSYSATVTFFGHTHVPCVFVRHSAGVHGVLLRGEAGLIRLEPGMRYLINPGSIGQPRDRDPRAAFMIYDQDRQIVRWQRVRYPIRRAQKRIVKAGLPQILADRLTVGM